MKENIKMSQMLANKIFKMNFHYLFLIEPSSNFVQFTHASRKLMIDYIESSLFHHLFKFVKQM
jgi:hypothetical protein